MQPSYIKWTPGSAISICKNSVCSSLAFMWGSPPVAEEEIRNIKIVEKIIDVFDLQMVRDQFVSELPYGKRNLGQLGRALALEPKILLLDEPSAGMNTKKKEDLHIWIKDIQEDYKVTILLIEHDMNMVMEISDRVLAMNQGEKIGEGTPQEVQRHPEDYQGLPRRSRLMLTVKNIETWYDLTGCSMGFLLRCVRTTL